MKKLLALSALALSFASTTAFATTTQILAVHGEVIGQTCEFGNSNSPNPSLQLVSLNPITLADLQAGKDNAEEISFNLTGCDTKSTQEVFITFDSNHQNVTANGRLANNSVGINKNAATGVQFKIMKEDGTPINLKDANAARSVGIVQRQAAGGNAEFKFKAGYEVEQGATPTTGLVTSNIPVTIAYQ